MSQNELTHALEEVCNILNKCGYELGNDQDTEYTNTATEYIDQVVEEYHTNKR